MDYHGGCQCGKTRYRAESPRDRSGVCYCRMCQKASGGPFMAFVRFRADQVHWTAPPAIFASSNAVERGFCQVCGTPLTFRFVSGPYISVTLNSLDDPETIKPDTRFCADGEVSWCRTLADLPNLDLSLDDTPGFINNQHPDAP